MMISMDTVRCFVTERAKLHTLSLIERVGSVALPALLSICFLISHPRFYDASILFTGMTLLTIGLTSFMGHLAIQMSLLINPEVTSMRRYRIELYGFVHQFFEKASSLQKDASDYRLFGVSHIALGLGGLVLSALMYRHTKTDKTSLLIAITSLGLIALGLSSYNRLMNLPSTQEIQKNLANCFAQVGEDDVCLLGSET